MVMLLPIHVPQVAQAFEKGAICRPPQTWSERNEAEPRNFSHRLRLRSGRCLRPRHGGRGVRERGTGDRARGPEEETGGQKPECLELSHAGRSAGVSQSHPGRREYKALNWPMSASNQLRSHSP